MNSFISFLFYSIFLVCMSSNTFLRISASGFEPISTQPPTFATVTHPEPPNQAYFTSALLSLAGSPASLPTNSWFENALLADGSNPLFLMPFAVAFRSNPSAAHQLFNRTHIIHQLSESADSSDESEFLNGFTAAFEVAMKFPHFDNEEFFDYLPMGLIVDLPLKISSNSLVATVFIPSFIFSSIEPLISHRLNRFDSLSADFILFTADSNSNILCPLVRGSTFITAIYNGQITPKFFSPQAIININGENSIGSIFSQVKKLKISLNSGQFYFIYSNQPFNAEWIDVNTIVSKSSSQHQLNSERIFRISALSAIGDAKSNEDVLDAHYGAIPMSSDVSYSPTADSVGVSINWNLHSSSTGDLLMAALPHHVDLLSNSGIQYSSLRFDSVKGEMRTTIGNQWNFQTPMIPIDFRASRSPGAESIESIKSSLRKDKDNYSLVGSIDSYGTGKLASAMARLSLIADELGLNDERNAILNRLQSGLEPWLTGSNPDKLVYDSSWGGILTSMGLADRGADYGQAWYNDHHFHFGYFLYAIAAVAKFNPDWAQQFRGPITDLARDIANPSADDKYFTQFRHFSLFDGHSWASGLFAFSDGRNQESSSESLNTWYGLALLGRSLGDGNMENVGRTLLTLEMAGVKRYWHSTSDNTVYPPEFAVNKCVGMVWGSKSVEATWFASGNIYIHGINFLPFTSLTEQLLDEPWIKEEFPVLFNSLGSSNPTPDEGWIGFMWGALAVLDPHKALEKIQGLNFFDNGNSRTNMLYWIATRPKFQIQPNQIDTKKKQSKCSCSDTFDEEEEEEEEKDDEIIINIKIDLKK